MFIRKEYEMKTVSQTELARDAFYNAYVNANRGKNKKFHAMFKRKQAKADIEYNKDAMATIIEMEDRDGKSWVDKIYQANGQVKPEKR